MSQVDKYELIRQKLKAGQHSPPKHKTVFEFLKIIWNEDDVDVLLHFEGVGKMASAKMIAERAGMDEEKVETILENLYKKLTIIKIEGMYGLVPLIPGIFELYFAGGNDTEENLKKAGIIFHKFLNKVYQGEKATRDQPMFLPKLPLGARKTLIKIDETIDMATQSSILPYELVEELIEQNDYFAKVPCQCRMVGEYAGDPCTLAPADVGCLAAGDPARTVVKHNMGEEISKEEAIDYLKRASEAGLIHNGGRFSGPSATLSICNCCPCHCPSVKAERNYRVRGVNPSNFEPVIDNELCNKCEICMRKCPVHVIFHKWPSEADSSDETMVIKTEHCLGCGVCAVNCPEEAIKMVRIRDFIAPESSPLQKELGLG